MRDCGIKYCFLNSYSYAATHAAHLVTAINVVKTVIIINKVQNYFYQILYQIQTKVSLPDTPQIL